MTEAFDPTKTYLDVKAGGTVETIPVSETFWSDLIAGNLTLEGGLFAAHDFDGDFPHWEMHPEGEEILVLLDGAMDVLLEEKGQKRRIELRPQAPCCVIPRGTWHFGIVPDRARVLFITWGEGTQHAAR